MAKPPPSGPEGDSGPDAKNQSDTRPNTPGKPGGGETEGQTVPAHKK